MSETSIAESLARKFAEHRELLAEVEAQLSRFKVVVDANPMPTVLIARTGETVYVNAAYTTFLGCNAEDLLDLGWKNFIEPGALPALVTEWEAFRNSDKEWFHTTTVFLAKGSTQNCTIIAVRIPADGYAAFIVPVECAKRMMHLCPGTPG